VLSTFYKRVSWSRLRKCSVQKLRKVSCDTPSAWWSTISDEIPDGDDDDEDREDDEMLLPDMLLLEMIQIIESEGAFGLSPLDMVSYAFAAACRARLVHSGRPQSDAMAVKSAEKTRAPQREKSMESALSSVRVRVDGIYPAAQSACGQSRLSGVNDVGCDDAMFAERLAPELNRVLVSAIWPA
jgi:hypothetical protein